MKEKERATLKQEEDKRRQEIDERYPNYTSLEHISKSESYIYIYHSH